MKRKKILPVLLAGGSGTRLWPLSRNDYPKQFLTLFDGTHSFFQKTLLRLKDTNKISFEKPTIITSFDYRFLVKEQMKCLGLEPNAIILEPVGKNTAPSILAALFVLKENFPDYSVLVLSVDHKIKDTELFLLTLEKAIEEQHSEHVTLFGIKPVRPESEFGYIKVKKNAKTFLHEVDRFIEKPKSEVAKEIIKDDSIFWNSGIFLFKLETGIALFEKHASYLMQEVKSSVDNLIIDLDFKNLDHNQWVKIPSISFDYAIMENIDSSFMCELQSDWNDMGSWDAVWRENEKDVENNVCLGFVKKFNCSDSLLVSDNENICLVGCGLENIVAVATEDAVLVSKRDNASELKVAVEGLIKNNVPQAVFSKKTHRPWGYFETLIKKENFHVKRISVLPGNRLSLQSHQYRSEHWVVVSGVATVVIGSKKKLVNTNESVYIPLGEKHRLQNNESVPLIIIEVQLGTYLEEDDIERYEDDYARQVLT